MRVATLSLATVWLLVTFANLHGQDPPQLRTRTSGRPTESIDASRSGIDR
jgi:hypothetical protein